MLVCKLISVVLLFRLARRLQFGRATTTLAVIMFSLSPLAVYFQRTALLDNLVTPWLLAAFFFAASPRRSIQAAAASATCFAIAVLTKETALLFMPALLLLFWQRTDQRNRKFTVTMYMMVVSLLGLMYPLYAQIKNELWAGPGHVSLQWAIQWQLFDRVGSGSIFDPASTAHKVVTTWLGLDHWSCLACLVAIVPGLLLRRTRAFAVAFAIQVSSLLRNGYLPYPFIIAMIPFAALTFAGVIDILWKWSRVSERLPRHAWPVDRLRAVASITLHIGTRLLVAGTVVALSLVVSGPWRYGLEDLWTSNRDAGKAAALSWLKSNVDHEDTLVVDDAFWVDLVRSGHPRKKVIWFTKLDVDKDVALPASQPWRTIDFIALDRQDALSLHLNDDLTPSRDTKNQFPTLAKAIENGRIVASFGAPEDRATIWRVSPPAPPIAAREKR
nr:glycosyltransferase family 39 protein [Microlunatus panaciterrae]